MILHHKHHRQIWALIHHMLHQLRADSLMAIVWMDSDVHDADTAAMRIGNDAASDGFVIAGDQECDARGQPEEQEHPPLIGEIAPEGRLLDAGNVA